MRILKPGKIAPSNGTQSRSNTGSRNTSYRDSNHRDSEYSRNDDSNYSKPSRESWDDFAPHKPVLAKQVTKKQEYSKGFGDRMVKNSDDRRTNSTYHKTDDLNDNDNEPLQQRQDVEVLEKKLDYTFKDRSLLLRSLTHRSALGVKERSDYERLEFLGDAVLDLSVAHLLSDLHPEAREGELSKMRAALVNTQALAQIAKKYEVNSFIRLGRGEQSAGGADRPSILADVMEALIGAVYRDSNYETALKLVESIFGDALTEVTPFDPKTELQEVLHANGSEPPSYLLELVEGPEHAPTFVTVVLVDNQIVGRGRGTTKKAAQQEAAAQALLKMMFKADAIKLNTEQKFFIESALLLPSELDQKRRPNLEQATTEKIQEKMPEQTAEQNTEKNS